MTLNKGIGLILSLSLLAQPVYGAEPQGESVPEPEATTSGAALTYHRVPNSDMYIVKGEGDWIAAGNFNNGSAYVADSNGTPLTDTYVGITPLSGSVGLFQYMIPAGHADVWCGVMRIADGQAQVLVEPGLTSYRGVDCGEGSFYFPVFTNGEYYTPTGEPIEDLGAYLKPYGISLERDSWASEAITDAIDGGYLPPELCFNYREDITRAEYCRLALEVYERANGPYKGKAAALDYASPFNDTDDYYVCAAEDLGIVTGMGDGSFRPDRYITRQEAAVLLNNLATLINREPEGAVAAFKDDASIAEWARSSVYTIAAIKDHEGMGVMVGTGDNCFSPEMTYSRQQAVVTVYRLLNR